MGLDTVELVMAVEETFDIEISDDDAEKIITVGDLYDCVMAKLSEREDKIDAMLVFARLRTVIAYHAGVGEDEIRHDVSFVDDLRLD